jgi:hypothetical protein
MRNIKNIQTNADAIRQTKRSRKARISYDIKPQARSVGGAYGSHIIPIFAPSFIN